MQHTAKQSGFSLLELLIVLGTMMTLTAITMTLMKDSIKFSNIAFEMADAQQNARNVQEVISRDLRNAGDGLNDVSTISVPTTFVTSYLTRSPVTATPLKLIISDDNVPVNTTTPAALPTASPVATPSPIAVRTGSDRITILIADTTDFSPITLTPGKVTSNGTLITVPDATKFNVREVYFIYSSIGATFGTVTAVNTGTKVVSFAVGDTFGLNRTTAGGINTVTNNGALSSTLMRVQIINYFVDSNSRLIRRMFGVGNGESFVDSLVAEHITSLNFNYGLNRDPATGDLRGAVSGLTTSAIQDSVRRVEVSVTAETTHPVVKGTTRPTVTMTSSTSIRTMDGRRALRPDN